MNIKKFFKWVSLFIMIMIFWFSHQEGPKSASQSRYVKKQIEKVTRKKVRINVRKNAHFFLYMLLGSSLMLSKEKKDTKDIMYTMLILIIYAMSDEFHQLFVPGRSASIKDVGIDSLGGLTGIFIVKIIQRENMRF